jgi:hypothetical protein
MLVNVKFERRLYTILASILYSVILKCGVIKKLVASESTGLLTLLRVLPVLLE